MKNLIKISSIASAFFLPNLVQAQASSPMEVSATVTPGCFIEADNINFGTLAMPLSDQSATSNMRVLCSKGSNLSIHLDYLNNGSTSTSNYKIVEQKTLIQGSHPHYRMEYKIYVNDKAISNGSYDFYCYTGKTTTGGAIPGASYKEYIATVEFGNFFNTGTGYKAIGICTSTGASYNSTTINSVLGGLSGILKGLAKSEQIKYSVESPLNSAQIWNASAKHILKTTGEFQTIPMKANIKSSENPTYRMSPDTYQAIMTVVLTY